MTKLKNANFILTKNTNKTTENYLIKILERTFSIALKLAFWRGVVREMKAGTAKGFHKSLDFVIVVAHTNCDLRAIAGFNASWP